MKKQANFVRFDQGSRDGFAGKNSSAVYVEGSAAKRLSSLAQEEFPRELSEHTRQNRERALRMNMSYVLFLTVAAFLTVFICINFLKLQAETTASQKELTKLEMKLSELKLANDSEYNRIIASVDLEEVKADAAPVGSRAASQSGCYSSAPARLTMTPPPDDGPTSPTLNS